MLGLEIKSPAFQETHSQQQVRSLGDYVPFFFFFCFFCFSGLHSWHMEVPRLGVKSELQLLAYVTATAMWDQSHILTYTTAHTNARSLTH